MRTTKWLSYVEEYAKNAGHFTIQHLFYSMKQTGLSISRACVYRSINKLLTAGRIVQISNGKERQFEFIRKKNHYHFICKKCGKVLEFFSDDVEKTIMEAAHKLNIIITTEKLVLEGYCNKCYRINNG